VACRAFVAEFADLEWLESHVTTMDEHLPKREEPAVLR